MREIKFRGISKEKRIFVYGCYIKASNVKEEIHAILEIGKSIDCITEVIKESVSQFTGLQDKNGVDIYEGDVMKRITNFEDGGCDVHLGIVKWDDCSFYSHSIKQEISRSLGGKSKNTTYEITGNIHEHPNLLK